MSAAESVGGRVRASVRVRRLMGAAIRAVGRRRGYDIGEAESHALAELGDVAAAVDHYAARHGRDWQATLTAALEAGALVERAIDDALRVEDWYPDAMAEFVRYAGERWGLQSDRLNDAIVDPGSRAHALGELEAVYLGVIAEARALALDLLERPGAER